MPASNTLSLVLCTALAFGVTTIAIPTAPVHAAGSDWGTTRKLPEYWRGTGRTLIEQAFFSMMDRRFGHVWTHTMQEEVVMNLWRDWQRQWPRREKPGP